MIFSNDATIRQLSYFKQSRNTRCLTDLLVLVGLNLYNIVPLITSRLFCRCFAHIAMLLHRKATKHRALKPGIIATFINYEANFFLQADLNGSRRGRLSWKHAGNHYRHIGHILQSSETGKKQTPPIRRGLFLAYLIQIS